ncbi:MAG: tRNA (adenosine(37)-N6)-threonylcarbamoyltransferase complex ATPase subunit type 1 TsaE [Candidatus Liptonbacteria bacterium]|nr:tRNA (adenosine(37)-N6)-threonylcarbamoyltransferase complex ATPase subunit type 1 TsaE [Candidatus Liptonbacteria bacterium]
MRSISTSPRETERLGFELARRLKRRRRGAAIIALEGSLGAGKTTFVRGALRALGVRRRVTSPTFILVKRVAISSPRRREFSFAYHADLYRIRSMHAARALELRDILDNPQNAVFIEWAGNAPRLLPRHTVRVLFEHGASEKERWITI